MRVCALRSFSSYDLDEGMKNVGFHLCREISKRHSVLAIDPRASTKPCFWREARAFRPHIIHYMAGPTIFSLALLRLLSILSPGSKTVISALHPCLPDPAKPLMSFLLPDLVLVQSLRTEVFFRGMGCRTSHLPNGVDIGRFAPVSADRKRQLREVFGIPQDKYILLHVGPIKVKRGLRDLMVLNAGDQAILIVGSPSSGYDRELVGRLEAGGCVVWRRYIQDIEKVYALSDCYVFPTKDPLQAIEVPLSVLEAMACNLPVLSYPFCGLPMLFEEGDGLRYFTSEEEMVRGLADIRAARTVRTRQRVDRMDWGTIGERLENAYRIIV